MKNDKQHSDEDFDTVFIRHAESHFNKGILSYIQKQQMKDITWMQLLQNSAFNERVTYNPDYIDPQITQNGFEQCWKAKQLFNPNEIDLVLVSPQIRALQTCKQIFGQNHKNVIVHPLATEVFRYSCDVSHPMEQKLKMIEFKNYNFQEMKNWTDEWFLQVLSEEKRNICQQHFQKNDITDFKAKQIEAVKLLSKQVIAQNAQQLRQRVGRLKSLISDLKKHHNATKVAVVSHHYTTQCLLSPAFHQNGDVKGIGTIQNGKPYFRKLQDIIKVR